MGSAGVFEILSGSKNGAKVGVWFVCVFYSSKVSLD